MSKRLQVLVDAAKLRRHEPQGDLESKLRAVRAAARHEGPSTDVDRMLAEIERGYAGGPRE